MGKLVLTKLGSPNVSFTLHDDFYAAGLGIAVGALDFEAVATGERYDGAGIEKHRVRWSHK